MSPASTKQIQRKRVRFLPHRYRTHGLSLDLESVYIDGEAIDGEVNPERQLVSLEEHTGWQEVVVRGRVEISKELLDDVLPEQERGQPPVGLLLALRCREVFFRRAEFLAGQRPFTQAENSSHADELAGSHCVELSFRRSEIRGKLEVTPFLVRSRDLRQDTAGFAETAGARLANGRPWIVRLDRHEAPAGDYLDVRFKDFSEMERLSSHPEALYFLQSDVETPVLWLNSSHQEIANILLSKGTVGSSARLRDVFYDHISQGVWTELFTQAVAALKEDGETEFGWQGAALDYLGKDMFPNLDEEMRVLELRERAQDPKAFVELFHKAGLILQEKHKLAEHMRKLIREVE